MKWFIYLTLTLGACLAMAQSTPATPVFPAPSKNLPPVRFDGGRPTAPHCEKATDCPGRLPMHCRTCADGTSACAHWTCVDNSCRSEICPGEKNKQK